LPDTRLSAADTLALSDFRRRVHAALGNNVVELRLFGSKARGDAGPDADLDVLVVVGPDQNRWPAARTVSDIAFDVNLEHEVFISPIALTATMMADPRWMHSPFLQTVRAEGVRL
jgi:predicted nucleotidyltransferase